VRLFLFADTAVCPVPKSPERTDRLQRQTPFQVTEIPGTVGAQRVHERCLMVLGVSQSQVAPLFAVGMRQLYAPTSTGQGVQVPRQGGAWRRNVPRAVWCPCGRLVSQEPPKGPKNRRKSVSNRSNTSNTHRIKHVLTLISIDKMINPVPKIIMK